MTTSQIVSCVLILFLFIASFYWQDEIETRVAPKTISEDEVAKLAAQKNEEATIVFYAYSGIIGEYAFVVLPLIVVWIVAEISGWQSIRVCGSPEFSFGTSILLGQTLIKIVNMVAKGKAPHVYPVLGLVSLLVVIGLVPSLIIMSFILSNEHPAIGLIITQMILFVIASFFYIGMGLAFNALDIAEANREKKELRELQRRILDHRTPTHNLDPPKPLLPKENRGAAPR